MNSRLLKWLTRTAMAVLVLLVLGVALTVAGLIGNPIYTTMVVTSDSMKPIFEAGDLIWIKPVKDQSEIRVGDIVTFTTEEGENLTHRIIGLQETGFITKGDNSPSQDFWTDGWVLKPTSISGEYLFRIPRAGYIFSWISSLRTGAWMSDRAKVSGRMEAAIFTPAPTETPALEPEPTLNPDELIEVPPIPETTPEVTEHSEPTEEPEEEVTPEPTSEPETTPEAEATPEVIEPSELTEEPASVTQQPTPDVEEEAPRPTETPTLTVVPEIILVPTSEQTVDSAPEPIVVPEEIKPEEELRVESFPKPESTLEMEPAEGIGQDQLN